jgi:hypothetical protein
MVQLVYFCRIASSLKNALRWYIFLTVFSPSRKRSCQSDRVVLYHYRFDWATHGQEPHYYLGRTVQLLHGRYFSGAREGLYPFDYLAKKIKSTNAGCQSSYCYVSDLGSNRLGLVTARYRSPYTALHVPKTPPHEPNRG